MDNEFDLTEALKYIDPACLTYQEWVNIGMALKSEGYSVVEMECASLAACADFRDIIFGQLLFTADSLANIESHDTRNWGNRHFALAMALAMDAAVEV